MRGGGRQPHLALDVSQVNGLCSNIQEHLLAPQLLVLSQEGEAGLRLLHALDVAVLQRERQQVLRAQRRETGGGEGSVRGPSLSLAVICPGLGGDGG